MYRSEDNIMEPFLPFHLYKCFRDGTQVARFVQQASSHTEPAHQPANIILSVTVIFYRHRPLWYKVSKYKIYDRPLKIDVFLFMCMCVSLYVYSTYIACIFHIHCMYIPHTCGCTQKTKDCTEFPRGGVTPSVGAGN